MSFAMSAERETNVADMAVERRRKRQAAAEAAEATHHDLAHGWCEARTVDGFPPVYSNGAFYVPGADALWLPISAERVQVEVARMFNGRKLCRKNSDFKQITDHIAALCEVEGFFDDAPPGVVSPAGFHVMSTAGAVETEPLTLDYRQTFALDYRPEYDADAPLLRGVLRSAFEGDDADAQIDLWWQCVGAALFGMMPRLQLVLLMLGRERSGKSLLQRVLERAFPAVAVGAVSPASWGHEYHVATLAGKRLNVVGELSDDAPIPAAAFKNVTGQNLVAGRHPTHRPFSFRCQAAHVFAANVLPPTTDRSEAFYRRWRVLRFANTVPAEKVDPDLLEKIAANEMPAVLAEAFLGAQRLATAGRMRTTLAHDAVLERWRHNANPLQQFLGDDEWVELDPVAKAHSKAEVYETYRRWAAAAGFRNPFSRNHFADLLESTGATRGVFVKRIETREIVTGVRLLARP
jgi:putative DNA primase/helicase